MSTVAYQEMKAFALGWEKIYKSAVCSGIVGDKRHQARGGYHIGRKFQSPNNYSVTRPADRRGQGPDDGSSAVDMTMNRADMILCTNRLAAAFNNVTDPRRKYINAFNGWDGSGPAARFDVYARAKKDATPDHKQHCHLEQRRAYIRDKIANEAIWSILRGESVATWLKSHGIAPGPPPAAPGTKPAAPKAPPYPGRTLQRNDRQRAADPAIRMWQQRMRDRGWTSIGKADGFAGPKFETTVKAWQKRNGLTPDGKVGPKTWPTPWTRPIGS